MFDIGFWELFVIGIVALVVIGPERLPGVARKAGLWMGKARRFVQTVKEDIDRELAADELKRLLKEQSESESVHEIIEETKRSIAEVQESIDETTRSATSDVKKAVQTPVEENPAVAPEPADGGHLVKAVPEPKAGAQAEPKADKQNVHDGESRS